MYSVSLNRSNRYNDSLASLSATLILFIKSAFDCPNSASRIIAQMLVPDLTSCLLIMNSCLSLARC